MRKREHDICRKIAIVLLGLSFVAAACSTDDATSAGDTADALDDEELSGSLSLVGNVFAVGEDSVLALAVAAFEEEHPDVTIEIEGMAQLDQMVQTLPSQINAGLAPDIISTVTGYGLPIAALTLAANDQLVDLTEEDWVEHMPDTIRRQISPDGRLYSLPTDMLLIGMHYNPAVFQAEGLRVPESFGELLELCETAIDRGTVGVALAAGEPYVHQDYLMHGLVGTNVYNDDPDFTEHLRDGSTTFADSGWGRALEQLQEMDEAGCFGSDPLAVNRETAMQQFAVGDAYMMGSFSLGQAQVEAFNPDAEFRLFPMPADDADQRRVPMAPVLGLVIPKSGNNIDLAKAFLSFLADHSDVFVQQSELTIPAIVNDLDNPPPLPDYLSELEPFVREGRVSEIYPDQWPYPDVRTVYNEGVASIVQGSMGPQQMLDRLDSAWRAAE